VAAILIETIASVRLQNNADAWHLSPGFAHAAAFGVVLALALVAATEAMRPPFTWSRPLWSLGCYAALSACVWSVNADSASAFVTAGILAAIGIGAARATTGWAARASLTLAAFAVAEYLLHQSLGITFGPTRALAASVILVALWASTIAIVEFSDRAFVSAFKTS
jgi:hypothetical protein